MYSELKQALDAAKKIVVIQAANTDGDSLASSLALEEILGEQGKEVIMYSSSSISSYLRYLKGWDRVTTDFPLQYDMAIIVDTVSDTLLSKLLETAGARHSLETHPVFVLDHHAAVESSLSFDHTLIVSETAVATGELIADIARELAWLVNKQAADALYAAIMADSLGLTTQATTPESVRTIAWLMEQGVVPAEMEAARRLLMKKSPEILAYKAELITRIEYYLEGALALIHIPWDEIEKYSDKYNPSILVLDEMRLVDNVELAVAIKTYPDGRVTGKLRGNLPIAHTVAGYFGGGGHAYSSGFRAYEAYDKIVKELVTATDKALKEYETSHASI